MLKKLLTFFLINIVFFFTNCISLASLPSNSDREGTIKLAQGSFLRATMQRELSTATNKMGDIVRMIATSPTFAADGVIIPANSIFIGELVEINQPIEGVNGSMRVNFHKIIFPSGDEMNIDAVLYSKNHNLIGGELTMPAYYMKIPHFTHGWKGGCLSFQGAGIYLQGVPTIIKAGTEMLIMLNQDTEFYRYEM